MNSHTVYRTFRTEQGREFVRITDEVAGAFGDQRGSGEDNGDAHLKQQIFDCEFDGQRSERLVIKVMGE